MVRCVYLCAGVNVKAYGRKHYMKIIINIFLILVACLFSSSFILKPKPHLIVGNWELIKKRKDLFIKNGQEFSIERVAISSDEITSGFYLINKKSIKKREECLKLAFRIIEHDEEFENPVILFKNICDEKTMIVFSILKLDKEFLKLKFEKKYSSDNVDSKNEILEFERTAGPPENMAHSNDALKLQIHIKE